MYGMQRKVIQDEAMLADDALSRAGMSR